MKLAFITMQKNEGILIDAFVKHHAYLSSYSDIYILDNGSSDRDVISKLERYEKKGVNVFYEYNENKHFENKGDIVLNVIKHEELQGKYDFIIPIDCDELFALNTDEGVTLDRDELHEYLSSLIDLGHGFRVTHCLNNMPLKEDCFKVAEQKKAFFSKESRLEKLDTGFHLFGFDEKLAKTKIIYLHFHNRFYEDVLVSARAKLLTRVDNFTPEYLEQYRAKKSRGWHLIKYFLQTEKQYYNSKTNENSGVLEKVYAKQHFEMLGCLYPYIKQKNKCDRAIFWLKNLVNFGVVDKETLNFLAVGREDRSLVFSFGDIQGLPNGNVDYSEKVGYGWVNGKPEHFRDRKEDNQILSKFVLSFKNKNNYKVNLPNGFYRVRVICHDSRFENHTVDLSIKDGEVLSARNKKGYALVFDMYTKIKNGKLDVSFVSQENDFILNALVIDEVDIERDSSVTYFEV